MQPLCKLIKALLSQLLLKANDAYRGCKCIEGIRVYATEGVPGIYLSCKGFK